MKTFTDIMAHLGMLYTFIFALLVVVALIEAVRTYRKSQKRNVKNCCANCPLVNNNDLSDHTTLTNNEEEQQDEHLHEDKS